MVWHIEFIEPDVIDKINILKSVMQGMHNCIKNTINKLNASIDDCTAVVDGNYFTPYMVFDNNKNALTPLKSVTIEQGDAKYMNHQQAYWLKLQEMNMLIVCVIKYLY